MTNPEKWVFAICGKTVKLARENSLVHKHNILTAILNLNVRPLVAQNQMDAPMYEVTLFLAKYICSIEVNKFRWILTE